MSASGHQKLSIFLMVASPCGGNADALVFQHEQSQAEPRRARTPGGAHPDVQPTGVRDVVVDVTVITQADDTEAHQGAHVQGEDGDEQRLHALQVAVEEDGHEHNLQGNDTQ